MSLLGFVYLTFYNIFFRILADNYSAPPILGNNVGDTFLYSDVGNTVLLRYTDIMDTIYNIFAWIDVFIDLDLLFGLFFLTLFYYGLKFASALAKRVMGCFK